MNIFSSDLINFEPLKENKYEHYDGGLVTVNNQLVAIGGFHTSKVEVLRDQKWNKIKSVPSSTSEIWAFSSLVINSTIYIFGKLI